MSTLLKETAKLDERIRGIEKQNRKLKGYVGVLAICLASTAMLGAKATLSNGDFNQIMARELVILDEAGQVRIRIGSNPEEGTGISLLNKDKKEVLGIGLPADEAGSGILFSDKEGRPRIGLGMDEGLPGMAFVDDMGNKIIAIGGDDRGYGLTILDKKEVERVGIGYKEGNTGVALYDEEGRYARGMVRQEDGLNYSSYMDKEGNEIMME